MQTSSEFATSVQHILEIHSGQARRTWEPKDFSLESYQGCLVKQPFRWYSTEGFQRAFGKTPQQLQVPVETFHDHRGTPQQGVLLRDQTKDYLDVEAVYYIGGLMHTALQKHENSLRSEQVDEFCKTYMGDRDQLLPKGLVQKSCPSVATMTERIKEFERKEKAAQDEAAAMASLVPDNQEEGDSKPAKKEGDDEGGKEEGGDGDDDDDAVIEDDQLAASSACVLPSEKLKAAKGKARGQRRQGQSTQQERQRARKRALWQG